MSSISVKVCNEPIRSRTLGLRDPDLTRSLLLQAARQEFAAKGLAGARVEEIVRLAGVNKQALYYHFGNKEDLFRETLEHGYREFRERDRGLDVESQSPNEALATVIGVTYDDLHHSPDLIAMIMDENRQEGRHLNRQTVRAINAPLIESLKHILARGERENIFRPGIDPEQLYISVMALLVYGFSHVYTLSAVLGRDLTTEAAARARRAHVIDFALAAVRR